MMTDGGGKRIKNTLQWEADSKNGGGNLNMGYY